MRLSYKKRELATQLKKMKKIIIIDDEKNICQSVCFALKKEGYQSAFFTDPVEALEAVGKSMPHLIILDIIMPGMDGFELLRQIRKVSEYVPVIFLSSKDEAFDRILGLEMGADDYMGKPFSMKELLARIKVCFRRLKIVDQGIDDHKKSYLEAGGLKINKDSYTAFWKGSALILTVTEFRILYALAEDKKKVKTREQLLTRAFPSDYYVSDRTVDTHIKRIRKKFALIEQGADPIETIFGIGYKYSG